MESIASLNELDTLDGLRGGQRAEACPKLFDLLPVELVSIVFEHYTHSWPFWPHRFLILGKISRRWRQIAWSTPSLWTKLTVWSRHATSRTHAELAEEWLSRSGTLPVSIKYETFYFHDHKISEEQFLEACGWMLETFSRHSKRWQSLSLSLPCCALEEFGQLLRPPTALQYLSLNVTRDEYDDLPDYPRILAFSDCSPKIVKLGCLQLDLDWTFVTDLSVDRVDIAEVLLIFQKAINLSKCDLLEVTNYSTDISTLIKHGPVTSLLGSLTITFLDESSPQLFCRTVALPALKHLEFDSCDAGAIFLPVDSLILFLTQSSCPLESLVFDRPAFEGGSLLHLAPILSFLTDIRISFSCYDIEDEEIDELRDFCYLLADPGRLPTHISPSMFSSTQPLLPALEKFVYEGGVAYPWETIPGLLKPFMPNGLPFRRPLKLVKISCHHPGTIDMPLIEKDVIRQLLEFTDIKYDFTLNSRDNGEGGIDWWKASLEGAEARS